MLKAILVRATALLTEMEAVPISGTYFKATEDIPPKKQGLDGYVAFFGNPSLTQDTTGNIQRLNKITFPGLLIGGQIGLGNPFTERCNLLDYADLIEAKFNERPLLNDVDMYPLGGVQECVFAGGRVFEDVFPLQQDVRIWRQFSFTLQIEYERYRVQSS